MTLSLVSIFNLVVTFLYPLKEFGDYISLFFLCIGGTVLTAAIGGYLAHFTWWESLAAILFSVLCVIALTAIWLL